MVRIACAGLLVSLLTLSAAGQGETPSKPPGFEVIGTVVVVRAPRVGAEAAERPSDVVKPLAPGWDVRDAPGARTVKILRSRGVAGREAAPQALRLGDHWTTVRALARNPRIEMAEPLLEAIVDQGEPLLPLNVCPLCPTPAVKYKRGQEPIQEALKQPEWVLDAEHGANFAGAATDWRDACGACGKEPGGGVIVGHPDTGYTRHVENFPTGATSAIVPSDGWNFVADAADPIDPLFDGTLRNPGHGTKTSSVIVSPKGSQFDPSARVWVTGVAPGARLIPLRVAEGVVLSPYDLGLVRVDMARLAAAIEEAVAPQSAKVKGPVHVLSISLGGLPSQRLVRALDAAERANVIVVAAAGNQVRQVVYPGRYSTVVAVAGSNYRSETWRGSSRGPAVDVTAPAESVWVAAQRQGTSCLQAGDGTSFATALTAGAAALWLSYPNTEHQAALKAAREAGALPSAFRLAIRSAFRSVPDWNTRDYGPGILDVRKLLAAGAPRGAAPEAGPDITGIADCNSNDTRFALASLEVLLDTNAAAARRKIAMLLRRNETASLCPIVQLADEIALIAALDPRVGEALRQLEGTTPPPAAYDAARAALLAADISGELRTQLTTTP